MTDSSSANLADFTDFSVVADFVFADPEMLLVSSDPLLNHRLKTLESELPATARQKIIERIVRMLLIEYGKSAEAFRRCIPRHLTSPAE